MRFLTTADPNRFPATNPTLVTGGTPARLTTVSPPTVFLSPRRMTSRKRTGDRSDSERRSGGETLAALDTARLEDGATGAGLHAMAEAVTTFAASDFGLIGAFHDFEESRSGGPRQATENRFVMSKPAGSANKIPRTRKNRATVSAPKPGPNREFEATEFQATPRFSRCSPPVHLPRNDDFRALEPAFGPRVCSLSAGPGGTAQTGRNILTSWVVARGLED